ncbi:MAG TPA: hypothetical protein PK222_10715 [Bacteroidales bacterium]|jgi:hypothetical protein|nr:hypothetical protein [Bacteroidales bacterium]
MIKEYQDKYEQLLAAFLEKVSNINTAGIPAPHIPSVGELYEKAKYRIAFFGMETKGWGDLDDLIKNHYKTTEQAFKYLTEDFRELEFVNWTNNFGTSFFNYVLLFLARFYNIDDWKLLRSDERYEYILKTFIWGNTNSIERYNVSAEQNGVLIQNWEMVKNASSVFDKAEYILKTCKPNILLVLNWKESEDWLCDNDAVSKKEELGDHLYYYYLSNTNTHVYWLAHPRWLSINIGFNESINSIIQDINQRGIHVTDIVDPLVHQLENNRIQSKYEYIGELAEFLARNNKIMSGYELAQHLNRNGFRTSYNTNYLGGRGTYKLIKDCYNYYSELKKQQVADSIANSFVDANGNYAYK